jgi:hypothetical protein
MTHDWNALVSSHTHYIVDCANKSGIDDVAIVLADADEMRQRIPAYFAEVIKAIAGRKLLPLESNRGEKIMVIPIQRSVLEAILSDNTSAIRPLTSAVGTLVLWIACLEPDEFKVIDLHRATAEHN